MSDHVHWSGIATDVIPFDGQDLTIGFSVSPTDPERTIVIRGTGTDVLKLPNSTQKSVVWERIPGTSPVLEARQDGHFDATMILIRRGA